MSDTKECKNCGRTLPINSFYKDKTSGDGRKPVCAECYNARQRAYRANMTEEQREKKNAYDREWARRTGYWQRYASIHTEELQQKAKRWNGAHREQIARHMTMLRKKRKEIAQF